MAHEAAIKERPQGDSLTIDEIARRYPDEWVVLVDMESSNMTTTAGVVHAHSPHKREAWAMAEGLREVGVFWTGKKRSPKFGD